MPGKYQIEGVFTLTSELEPEGYLGGIEDSEGVTDYEDTSSWDTPSFTAECGVVSFTVEADSEDEARDKAQYALDNAYFTEHGSISWEIEDYSISSIECIEEPMSMGRAAYIVGELLARLPNAGTISDEENAALDYILDHITP